MPVKGFKAVTIPEWLFDEARKKAVKRGVAIPVFLEEAVMSCGDKRVQQDYPTRTEVLELVRMELAKFKEEARAMLEREHG